jgi:hypothetical protein
MRSSGQQASTNKFGHFMPPSFDRTARKNRFTNQAFAQIARGEMQDDCANGRLDGIPNRNGTEHALFDALFEQCSESIEDAVEPLAMVRPRPRPLNRQTLRGSWPRKMSVENSTVLST